MGNRKGLNVFLQERNMNKVVFERDPWTELELKEQIKTRREKDRMLSTSTL